MRWKNVGTNLNKTGVCSSSKSLSVQLLSKADLVNMFYKKKINPTQNNDLTLNFSSAVWSNWFIPDRLI